MLKNKKENNLSPRDQWAALNHILRFYKILGGLLAATCVTLTVLIFILSLRGPVVALKSDDSLDYYQGSYQKITINEETIEKAVRRFIKYRYEWQELSPKVIAKDLLPITTKGANRKIEKALFTLRDESFKGKKVEQGVANIKVQVTKEKVIASFDKVLRIEGLPLPIPTLIHLNIIKEGGTRLNPEGLYVHGVIERRIN